MSRLIKLTKPSEVKKTGDVIFVHGLDGDPMTTWGLSQEESWVKWLQEDRPDLDIWSIGYDASPSHWFEGNSMPLVDRATNILSMLDGNNIGAHPICFITHSMGGLLVKQMLRHSSDLKGEFNNILRNTKGIVFLATPHTGSDLASLVKYIRFFLRPTAVVKELESHAPPLRNLNQWFRSFVSESPIEIKVFFETRQTNGFIVVDPSSADPGIPDSVPIPLDSDHSQMCIPKSKGEIVYLQTLKLLKLITVVNPPQAKLNTVSELHTRLLTAASVDDLKRLKYELQNHLTNNPGDIDALMLTDRVDDAIKFDQTNLRVLRNIKVSASRYSKFRSNVWKILCGLGCFLFLGYYLGILDFLKRFLNFIVKLF